MDTKIQTTKSTEAITQAPYRDAIRITTCGVCKERAIFRCPRCGQHYCQDHWPTDGSHRCLDCEMAFDRKKHLVNYGTTGIVSVIVFLSVVAQFFYGDMAYAVGIVGALGSLFLRVLTLKIARAKFLAQGDSKGTIVLENAELKIADQLEGGSTSGRNQKSVQVHQNKRLEPPCSPIWQRTFGH